MSGVYPKLLVDALFQTSNDGIVSHAGGGQANATPISYIGVARITTVANPGDSIKLPPAVSGFDILIINHDLNIMQVFGQPGDTIDDISASIGVPQMVDSVVLYTCVSSGQWYTEGLASGYARGVPGQFATFSTQAGVVASTTHTQAGGVPITAMNVQIATASVGGGDAVTLPVAKAGMEITIVNNGAGAVQVYGNATDSATINGTAAATGISLAITTPIIFYCFSNGVWLTK